MYWHFVFCLRFKANNSHLTNHKHKHTINYLGIPLFNVNIYILFLLSLFTKDLVLLCLCKKVYQILFNRLVHQYNNKAYAFVSFIFVEQYSIPRRTFNIHWFLFIFSLFCFLVSFFSHRLSSFYNFSVQLWSSGIASIWAKSPI